MVANMIRALASASVLLLAMFATAAASQQNGENAAKSSKPPRVYTNDDVGRSHSRYDKEVPEIPGLIKCGEDVDCFLQALDDATPAALTRIETAEQGTAVVTSESTWWTTKFDAGRCTLSFRVDSLDATVNGKVVDAKAARDAAEAKLEEMKRDFASVRGQTETCTLAVKDVKGLMTSASWSLMALGPASQFGKSCSGPGFGFPPNPLPKDKK
jgi:hypothetical protein